jgi:hypothetical protein
MLNHEHHIHIMILPKWSTFILQYPQHETLENAYQQIIDAFASAVANTERMAKQAAIHDSPSTFYGVLLSK